MFLGESAFEQEVNEKTLDAYRSKKLLHSFGHPSTIKFQKKNQRPLNFTWKDSQWTYSEDKTLPLDSSHLNTFWTEFEFIKRKSNSQPCYKSQFTKI